MERKNMQTEVEIALGSRTGEEEFSRLGEPSLLTCPECQGSMVRIREGLNERYRCHTGHAFGEVTLAQQQLQSIESAMTHSLALLEEREFLYRGIAERDRAGGNHREYERHLAHADEMRQMAEQLKKLIEDPAVTRPIRASGSGDS